jgi:hypothetical protein
VALATTWLRQPPWPLPAVAAAVAVAIATAATATTATATAATTTTAARSATASAILRLVDADPATVELAPVHGSDRLLGASRRVVGHEAEAPRPTGLAISDDLGLDHRSERLEGRTKAEV